MPVATGAASRTILYCGNSLRILYPAVAPPSIPAVTTRACEATLILYDACSGRSLARLLGIRLLSPGLMELRIFRSQMTFRFHSKQSLIPAYRDCPYRAYSGSSQDTINGRNHRGFPSDAPRCRVMTRATASETADNSFNRWLSLVWPPAETMGTDPGESRENQTLLSQSPGINPYLDT